MTPRIYYQDDAVTLWHGDCRDVLPTLEAVDAVITDPPYGIGFAHGGGGGCLTNSTRFAHVGIAGDSQPFDPSPLLAFPVVILWGGNHFASRLPDRACWLVWDKRDGVCSNDQADCEMAWSSLRSPARLKRHLWNGMLKESERGERRLHPMQKPVELMAWCIEQSGTPEGATILDPYMGSGTVPRAAKDLGRKAIGIEIEERYCEIAAKRMEQGVFNFAD